MAQVYCSAGDTRKLVLPDGTEAILNGATSIVYPERFDGNEREVVLMGEASFKVAKDKVHPFVVKSNGVSVTALGTEFNMKAYPQSRKVESTLLDGKVKVNYGEAQNEFVLQPSEHLVYDRTTGCATLLHPKVDDVTAWQRGELVFNNTSLCEILSELESRFSQDFVYNASALPTDRYSFRFRKGMTLREVMGIVEDVAGNITVSIDDNSCRVRPV